MVHQPPDQPPPLSQVTDGPNEHPFEDSRQPGQAEGEDAITPLIAESEAGAIVEQNTISEAEGM